MLRHLRGHTTQVRATLDASQPRSQNFDLADAGLTLGDDSPASNLEKSFATGNDFTGYANPDFDAAVRDLRAARTVEEQQAALGQVQRIWNDTVPSVIFGAAEELVIWSPDLHGLRFNHEAVVHFDTAYLD